MKYNIAIFSKKLTNSDINIYESQSWWPIIDPNKESSDSKCKDNKLHIENE